MARAARTGTKAKAKTTGRRTRVANADQAVRTALAGATEPIAVPALAARAGVTATTVRSVVTRNALPTRTNGRGIEVLPLDGQPATPAATGTFRATSYTINGAAVVADETGNLYTVRPLVEGRA